MVTTIILNASLIFTDEDAGPKILRQQKVRDKIKAKSRHSDSHHITQVDFWYPAPLTNGKKEILNHLNDNDGATQLHKSPSKTEICKHAFFPQL